MVIMTQGNRTYDGYGEQTRRRKYHKWAKGFELVTGDPLVYHPYTAIDFKFRGPGDPLDDKVYMEFKQNA